MWEECCEGDEGGVSTCRATRKRFKCLGSTHSKAHGLLYHQNPSPHPRDREWAFNRYNGSVDAYEKALLDIESKEDHAQNAVRTRVDTYLAMLAKHFNAKGKLHPHDASLQHIVAREVRAERQAYDEEVYSRFNKAFKDIIKTITKRHKGRWAAVCLVGRDRMNWRPSPIPRPFDWKAHTFITEARWKGPLRRRSRVSTSVGDTRSI